MICLTKDSLGPKRSLPLSLILFTAVEICCKLVYSGIIIFCHVETTANISLCIQVEDVIIVEDFSKWKNIVQRHDVLVWKSERVKVSNNRNKSK